METTVNLKERIQQFDTLSLPGQMPAMHMGTSYLVHDLWNALQAAEARLRLAARLAEALKQTLTLLPAPELTAMRVGSDGKLTDEPYDIITNAAAVLREWEGETGVCRCQNRDRNPIDAETCGWCGMMLIASRR